MPSVVVCTVLVVATLAALSRPSPIHAIFFDFLFCPPIVAILPGNFGRSEAFTEKWCSKAIPASAKLVILLIALATEAIVAFDFAELALFADIRLLRLGDARSGRSIRSACWLELSAAS